TARGGVRFGQESVSDGRVPGEGDGREADGRGDGPAEVGVAGPVDAGRGGHGDRAPAGELGYQRVDGGRGADGGRLDGGRGDAQVRPAGPRQGGGGQQRVARWGQPG